MNADLNATRQHFDLWAHDGSAQRMEHHHAYPTQVAFEAVEWDPAWRALDIGCGSGWATRLAAEKLYLGSVVGLELSPKMAELATNLSAERANIEILNNDLFGADLAETSFDLVHANESLYYILPLAEALKKIHGLLKEKGTLLGIVDYYTENEASHVWSEQIDAPMELRSEAEYVQLCQAAGFTSVTTRRILHPAATEEGSWQQTVGSLFVRAVK